MKNQKREQVVDYLLAELQKTPCGGKLPSVLKIQQNCGVSQTIVTRVIDELKAMDLVEVKPQSGFYKKSPGKKNIHIVFPKKDEEKDDKSILELNSFYNNHLNAIQSTLTIHGYSVNFYHPDSLAELPLFHRLPSSKSLLHDIIITFSLPKSQLEIVRLQEERGFRFIHWLPNFVEPCYNSITIDEHVLMETQIRFLVDRGHRRIAYAHRCRETLWGRASNARYDEFCRQNIARRLQILPDYLFYLDARDTPQEACDREIARLMAAQPPPTALIVTDEDAKMVYNALQRNGFEPGRDIAVLGTNNHHWGEYMTPTLSSVGFDIGAGTAHLLDIIRSELDAWTFPTWIFPIVCAERESTRMPAAQLR